MYPQLRPTVRFTQDWFTPHIPMFTKYVLPFTGKPNLQFLEIGSFEGRSACWLLEHVLTHPTSCLTCIDTFLGSHEHRECTNESLNDLEQRFDANMRAVEAGNRVRKIKGESSNVLRQLPAATYDCIYIDGSHFSIDVLTDAVLSWPLLKEGGMLIFDDYQWSYYKDVTKNPKTAIDAFLTIFAPELTVLEMGWQVFVTKRARDRSSTQSEHHA